MNRKATLIFALLALAFDTAQAIPVTEAQVKYAAKAWVERGGTLGAGLGRTVEKVSAHSTTNGAAFYAVKMQGGGTLFMSSDTDYSPVIAFTSSGSDFSSIDRKSPLWALLNRDVSSLKSATASLALTPSANSAVALKMASLADSGSKLWGELIAEGEAIDDDSGLKYADPIVSGNPGDLRVGPLMQSKWGQTSLEDGSACWNYYTPNGSDPAAFVEGDAGNATCGCVATAMAQVMRYHSYPTSSLAPLTRECLWGTDSVKMSLTTQGGIYDWSKMALDPNSEDSLATENYQAIGKLTSDAGISVYMQYNSDGKGSSGAFSFDICGALKDYWQYGSAVYFAPSSMDGSVLETASRSAMYSNFDAGLPVLMGIPGHQIVADGYGWNNDLEYVHLNMGWSGQSDFWYNLPEMTVAHAGFNAVDDLVYNVIPSGSSSSAVISGRTLDDEGSALAGAFVELYQSGSLVTQVVTSAQGVWGVVVTPGTYDILAYSADGMLIGDMESVSVTKPYPVDTTWNSGLRVVPTVSSVESIGNSWGNDIVLMNPSVRIGSDIFGSLDKALVAARSLSDPLVEIIAPTELRKSVSVDFACTLVSVGSNPADMLVTRRNDAVITVAGGGALAISNVAFSVSDVTVLDVATGGTLAVSGKIDFGVEYDVPDVTVADAGGFVVAGMLEYEVQLDCAAAPDLGQSFGTLTGLSAEDAAKAALYVVNFNDDTGEIRGSVEGTSSPFVLKWAEQEVPFDVCACYYVDDAGNTNTSAKLDRILVKFASDTADGNVSAGAEIVVRKSGAFRTSVTVGADLSVRGENGAVLDATAPAGFIVTNGTLTVQGLGFKDYRGNALFYVNGGGLVMDSGVSIVNAVGTNKYSGAVAVFKGSATLGPDIEISGCRIENVQGGNGGAVYVKNGATLNFFGGTITGCSAISAGGGIYLDNKAILNMKGEINITGNTGSKGIRDNIYVFTDNTAVTVTGPVSGCIGIACSGFAYDYGNESGYKVSGIATGLSVKDIAGIARGASAFECDADSSLSATLSADQKSIVWTDDALAAGTVPDNLVEYAVVRVVEPGSSAAYYWSIADAFTALASDGSSVEMLTSDNFDGTLTVENLEVSLVSDPSKGVACVTGGTFKVTGSLALGNVALSGENLFDVDGGMLLLDGAVASPVGCVGGSEADTNVFATVRCSLSYDSLTNSAANFRNVELDAYGIAVTNDTAGTAIVWSRAIASDGTFTGADGVIWGCVGEVPVYETAVVPVPIAFSAIMRDEVSGSWNLTLTNLVRGCWYSLYATNSLSGGFAVGDGVADPVTNFQSEVDGEFIFSLESPDGASMFWKATAEPGVITE